MRNRNWIIAVTSFTVDNFTAKDSCIIHNHNLVYAAPENIVIQNRVCMDIVGIIYVLHSFFDHLFLSQNYGSILHKILRARC